MRGLGITAWTVFVTTVALVQSEAVFQTGLVLICLGGALMFAVCLFADRQ
jgi:hypothetical protein